jgi:hypothetical protein
MIVLRSAYMIYSECMEELLDFRCMCFQKYLVHFISLRAPVGQALNSVNVAIRIYG